MERKPRKSVYGIPTFYGVYEDCKQEVMTYGGRGWNAATSRQYDAIVLNHLVPYLQNHDQKNIGSFTRQDYDHVLSELHKQGKNAPDEPFEPWDADGVPEKVEYLMRAVVWTASVHDLAENVFGDKEITRSGGGRRTGEQQAKTMKSLSVRQEIAVHQYLMNRLDQTDPSPGLMLMYALGLRNNEACGINFGYIREFTQFPGHYYLIVPQSTELGSNTLKVIGKTANSGRRIPLPTALTTMLFGLQSKRAKLAEANGDAGNGEDLPIACKMGKPWERCGSDDLTTAARRMFETIGMRMEDIVALNQDLLEEAQAAEDEMEEDEFREIESAPTCYLLRRNFATHIAVLGLSDAEIRYVIGHKIDDEYIQRRAFGDEKMLFRIKRKMDERPLLNTIQPEQIISVEPDRTMFLSGSKKIALSMPIDQFSNLRISVTAKEPGDEIRFKIMGDKENAGINAEYITYSVEPSEPISRTFDGIRTYHHFFQK